MRDFSLTSDFTLFSLGLKSEIVVRHAHHCFYCEVEVKELPTMYESIMVKLFWICVDFLEDASDFFGITYEELNIWVFIIIHPLITIALALMLYKSLKRESALHSLARPR